MEKIYLLLRHNTQSGPFSIEELREKNLQPTDLIWAEGKSKCWLPPSGLPELSHPGTEPFSVLKEAPPLSTMMATAAGQLTSMEEMALPVTMEKVPINLEERAEQLRQKILSHSVPVTPEKKAEAASEYKRIFYLSGEKPAQEIEQALLPLLPLPHLIGMSTVALLLFAGWFSGLSPINEKKDTVDQTVTPLFSAQEYTAAANRPVTIREAPVEATVPLLPSLPVQAQKSKLSKNKNPNKSFSKRKAVVSPELKAIAKNVVQEPAVVPTVAPVEEVLPMAAEPQNTVQKEEKKKTIGQVFKGLFKKKKKEKQEATDGE